MSSLFCGPELFGLLLTWRITVLKISIELSERMLDHLFYCSEFCLFFSESIIWLHRFIQRLGCLCKFMENGAVLHSRRLMKVMRIQLNTSNGIEQSHVSDEQVSDNYECSYQSRASCCTSRIYQNVQIWIKLLNYKRVYPIL